MRPILLIISAFLITLSLVSIVSADIILSDPNPIYNLGDTMTVSATINSAASIDGFFSMFLICNGAEQEFYREYMILNSGEQHTSSAKILLREGSIGNAIGSCRIKGKINDQYSITKDFKISNQITLTSHTDKTSYNPLEGITISGSATKENGNPVQGYVELSIDNTNIESKAIVDSGSFLINFSYPQNQKSGQYTIRLKTYEKDSTDKITNTGTTTSTITINQVPAAIEITIDNVQIMPGSTIKITPIIYDQAHDTMQSQTILSIKDPNDKIIDQLQSQSGIIQNYDVSSNAIPGTWKIFAVAYTISGEKFFTILEKNEIAMRMIDNETLYVENTGNIPYTKNILVKIGDSQYPLPVNLNLGESKRIDLTKQFADQFPNGGAYPVKVSDGKNEYIGQVTFTGKTVSSTVNDEYLTSTGKLLFWILLLIVIGGLGFFIYGKTHKKEAWEVPNSNSNKLKSSEKKEFVPLKGNELDFSTGKIKKAVQAQDIHGEQQTSMVICLKLKNIHEIMEGQNNVKETLNEINKFADHNKAVLYEAPGILYYLFIPQITKTYKNGKATIDLAKEIKESMEKHNKFFKQRIEYGLSAHLGNLVAKIEKNNIVKFAPLGDILQTARKISEISDSEPLLSEALRNKVMANVKTERFEKNGIVGYKIQQVLNREENKKFLNDFMSRNPQKDSHQPKWKLE